MNYIQDVNQLVEKFTTNTRFVQIRTGFCLKTAKRYLKAKKEGHLLMWGMPACLNDPEGKVSIQKLVLYELIANSVNYCYWLGDGDIRPNDACSGKMYNLLTECFEKMNKLKQNNAYSEGHEREIIIENFIRQLSRERFPLLEHRVRHLREVMNGPIANANLLEGAKVEDFLDYLVITFPGYAADPFLKRAFLLTMQLHRTMGVFTDEIKKVPVPADYQVPKMLRWHGCISYNSILENTINGGRLIPEGSKMECEIRAATIKSCSIIAEEAGCTPSDIDGWLCMQRKDCDHPFHLTNTTHY